MKVEKLILDSPIANSKKRIKEDAAKRKVPKLKSQIKVEQRRGGESGARQVIE